MSRGSRDAPARARVTGGARKLREFRKEPGPPEPGRFVLPGPAPHPRRAIPGRSRPGHGAARTRDEQRSQGHHEPRRTAHHSRRRSATERCGRARRRVRTSRAADPAASPGRLVAPPTLRPVLAAALARGTEPGASGFVLAVTATAREAEDLAAGLGSFLPPDSVAVLPGLGDPAARAAVAPLGHGRAADRGAPAAGPPGARGRAQRSAVGGGHAGAEPAAADRGRARRPRAGRTARRVRPASSTTCSSGWSRSATRGPTWSATAARSPCAAASSTCSRPPRSTRCGWSSSATRSRRSATSRSPTSAASARPTTACGRRRAVSCCLPRRSRERAKILADTHPALADILGKLAEGIAVEGMEAFAPVLAERMELLVDYVPAGGRRAHLRPGAGPGPGRGTGPHQPGVPRGVLGERGRRRARRRSTSARRRSSRSTAVRDAAAGLGLPVVDDRAVRGDRRGRATRARPPSRQSGRTSQVHLPRSVSTPRWRRPIAATPPACSPTCAHWLARGLAGSPGHRGPRAGPAAGRDAPRRGASAPGCRTTWPSRPSPACPT